MKKTLLPVLGLLTLLVFGASSDAATPFEPLTNLVWRIPRFARIDGNLMTIDVPEGKRGAMCVADVDLSKYDRGGFVAQIYAEGTDISVPTERWNGLKFMFSFEDPQTGEREYPNTSSRLGSFTNQPLTVSTTRPSVQRRKARLSLGLQSSSGKVVFDLSTLRIASCANLYPFTNTDYRVSYPDRVRNLPPLRGVMLPGGKCTEDDFRTLHAWGATLARYQMTRGFSQSDVNRDLPNYDKWLNGKLDHLERDVLPWAAKYGIKIIVDLHSPAGGRESTREQSLFFNSTYADHFITCWKRIAARFKGHPQIYGYDLINEPNQIRRATVCDYWTLQKRAAEAIRVLDPETPIIIESNGWDSADTFTYLCPLAMDNVIYQVHMYQPHTFTHQGIGKGVTGTTNYPHAKYPDPAKHWDKAYLKGRLKPVLEFQKRHNARILVGEFSAITWGEGAEHYIADCIDIFEEYGWDWTYHAFREWNGWSVEHEYLGDNKFKPSPDNPRRRALLDGFKRGAR